MEKVWHYTFYDALRVEHDDDFAYDCEEVEVIIEAGDPLPEGTIDLNADDVQTFYNTELEALSVVFPAATELHGTSYPTLEHYWQAAPFLGTASEELSTRIA